MNEHTSEYIKRQPKWYNIDMIAVFTLGTAIGFITGAFMDVVALIRKII